METFYSKGSGNYESERLATQLKGGAFNANTIDIIKQSAKMMYVGLSRPTHIVCLAVHESRFNAKLSDIDRNTWEVIEI